MIETLVSKTGEQNFIVYGQLTYTSEGVIIQILGGEKPHIGTVIISIPRKTKNENSIKTSCTTSVFNMTGHKDDIVAKPISEMFAKELNQVVTVIAGIHVPNADQKDIEKLSNNCYEVAYDLLDRTLKLS
ncbi:hypothetical protein [Natranaerofaba carboxydovora]|uniref:prenylated flavin chaperone LpdD n=1 Tax=Natranaerofaba carboxydovora TaxID=2742683 RepID=UPI001F141C3C|nr:hypothetical protein [Natranaerofaba carboxydovora]UMZ73782.1 hypothetical protein ACONDI_01351 [Natranaerofaba carboxydovora]